MGKKKGGGRKGPREEEFLDDDSSASTLDELAGKYGQNMAEYDDDGYGGAMDMAVDALYEKRGATREKGLQSLIAMMCQSVAEEECEERFDTLSTLFRNGIRRGGGVEGSLSARALGILGITLGPGEECNSILDESTTLLLKAGASGKSDTARVAALEALAMLCFVGAENPATTADIMDRIFKGFGAGSAEVRKGAVKAWTLLLTTVAPHQVAAFTAEALPTLSGLLNDKSTDVRAAAGEAVAVLNDASPDPDSDEEEVYTHDYTSPEFKGRIILPGDDRGAQAAPGALSDVPRGMTMSSGSSGDSDDDGMGDAAYEGVVSQMERLSKASDDRHRSKKDRASMRSTFRGLSDAVKTGRCPTQKVKLIHGDSLVVDTWAGVVQLSAFRRLLAEGFQTHLQGNGLLHDVFSFSPVASAGDRVKYSKTEKRLLFSPNSAGSKARDLHRGRMRQNASSQHLDCLHGE